MCLMCEMEALYFAQLAEQAAGEQQLAEQQRLAGEGAPPPEPPAGVARVVVGETETTGTLFDRSGLVARRWGLVPGEAVLLRPDQHVAARLSRPDPAAIAAARDRALGHAA